MAGLIDMAVTPNYGWPVPVATDYVKDGYAAIADLGDAIDATVYGQSSALVLVKSQVIGSAVASVTSQVHLAQHMTLTKLLLQTR
jgi:hypothetical protein